MKKSITACILILLLLMVLADVCACVPQDFCALKYTAGEGGKVVGELQQSIKRGTDGTTVTAVADDGYYFVKWSDDVLTAERQDRAVQDNINVTAIFSKSKSYTITYLVEEGGTLEGEAMQTICEDDGGTKSVSVNIKDGYEFLGWSDGHDELWRSDSYFNINYYYKQDTTFTARIRRIDDYKLMDWYTEFGVGVPTIEINAETYNNLSFPIPKREHFTFEGWYFGDTLVADTQGKSYFTKEMLEEGSRSITAKWTPNETFTYKILLVYVTRIDAVLPTVDQTSKIHVDYTISDLEREFYHWTTIRLKQYLDEMVDGMIDFQVDEYYTKQTVVSEDFKQMGPVGSVSNHLDADQIPEVKNLIKEYDSALSVFSINDIDYKLHSMAGSASPSYGQIYLDGFLSALNVYKFTLEQVVELLKDCQISDMLSGTLYDMSYVTCGYWFYTFAHELAHTIELRINGDNWHTIENELNYRQHMKGYDPFKYYYLQEVIQDGKKVGIPYEFWSRNIMQVRYEPSEGGTINKEGYYSKDYAGAPHGIYDVPYGYDTPSVTAVARNGYEFIEWSDGVKAATRTDVNVTKSMTITAIFKPLTYELTVVAGEGGQIVRGEGTFAFYMDGKNALFTAKADEGYKFLGWSDGAIESNRSFRVNIATVKLFDENRQYTLTAIFVKIGEQSDYYVLNLAHCENGQYNIQGGFETQRSILMKKGVDMLQVYALSNKGYRFVQWSDGYREYSRMFIITSELEALSNEDNVITIYAIFEKIEE